MGITVNHTIYCMIQDYPQRVQREVLRRAWDACCDGSYLPEGTNFDPWNGHHEAVREAIEEEAVKGAIACL
jgi:hypothetical protein